MARVDKIPEPGEEAVHPPAKHATPKKEEKKEEAKKEEKKEEVMASPPPGNKVKPHDAKALQGLNSLSM